MCLESYKDCKEKKRNAKRPKTFLLYVLIIGLFFIANVSAETYSGDLTFDTPPSVTEVYTLPVGSLVPLYPIDGLTLTQVELYRDLNYIFMHEIYANNYSWDSGVYSCSSPVIITDGAATIGTGTMGFNKNIANGEILITLSLDTWDIGSRTGAKLFHITGAPCNLKGYFVSTAANPQYIGFGETAAADGRWIGKYNAYSVFNFLNRYTAVSSGSLPINTINVTKYGNSSRVRVYQTDSILLTDEGAYNTNQFNLQTTLSPLKIAVNDLRGYWHNTSYFFGIQPIYSIIVNPSSITSNQSAQGTITSTKDPYLTQILAVNWQYYTTDPLVDLKDLYENGDNIHGMNYVLKTGNWYGWNVNDMDFTNNKGATLPNPVSLFPQSSGNLTVLFTVYTLDGNMQQLTAPLFVGAGGITKTIILEAADWQSGMLISPVNWSVKNLYTNNWSNKTSTSGDGTWTVQYSAGITLYVEANAYGYVKGTLTKQVPSGNDIWILQLYPLTAVSGNITNTTLLVKVLGDNNDGKFQPLNNVAVTLSDTQSQLTASLGGVAGQAQFTVKNDTIYSISAKKDKYISVTKTVFVTGDIYTTTLFMSPLEGSTVIPTTATTRPTATPTVTLSGYQPAYGNFTGFWAPFENMGVAMGAQPNEVGVLMMFLLIIGFLILGGWAAGPLGAEVGVVAGMVCSVAFGFLPFAISIAVIAILCLYGALRIWGVTR